MYCLGVINRDLHWVDRNDNEFKFHLDRYKYPNRYENVDSLEQRSMAKAYLDDLDQFLSNEISHSLSDALFPFVRQFANHDREWFDAQNWEHLHDWLANNLSSKEFALCMKKYPSGVRVTGGYLPPANDWQMLYWWRDSQILGEEHGCFRNWYWSYFLTN